MAILAAWLVARGQNAVLALAAGLLLPLPQLTSAPILILIALQKGLRVAVVDAILAGALLALVWLIFRAPLLELGAIAASTWIPALLLAAILIVSGSLTLTLQLTVILFAVAILTFYMLVGDVAAFWKPMLAATSAWLEQNGLHQQARLLASGQASLAQQMTMAVATVSWTLLAAMLLLGNGLYRLLPTVATDFGRFGNLSFGRVIAVTMALASVLALVLDAASMQALAFFLFAAFWLQGLAILYWLNAEGVFPTFGLIVVFVLLLLLNVLIAMALAAAGYADAWFQYRQRVRAAR